ncbi:MAG: MotA/TolQ/ExbB proton channel family protein [Myxococcota bacterium]
MNWLFELTNYIVQGGPVMIPIGIASVVGLAAFLERLVALQRSRVAPADLVRKVLTHVEAGEDEHALALCKKRPSAAARLLTVAIEHRGSDRQKVKERLEEVGRREAAELERFIPIVGIVASVSPLLGLLGTVGGMIVTFAAIQEQGLGDVDKLAGGISQALITTFAGLSVGIPALIANRFLLGRVDGLLIRLEEVSLEVLDCLCDEPAADEE